MRSGLGFFVVAVVACNGHHGATGTDAQGDAIPPGCGNGVREGMEQCDGTDLGGADCSSAAAPGWVGVLACSSNCTFDIAACRQAFPDFRYTPLAEGLALAQSGAREAV